jgi:hypothetical protein
MNCIIVPIYKEFEKLNDGELLSLNRLYKILGKHQVILFGPTQFNWNKYLDNAKDNLVIPLIKEFDKKFFQDINGYNKLLLSLSFYKAFKRYDYFLLYQLDAFVFRDEFDFWCKQSYDYIGAPWNCTHFFSDKAIIGVGNGGFSLRNVKSCIRLLKDLRRIEILEEYNNFNWKGLLPRLPVILKTIISTHTASLFEKNYSFQEDIFWCISAPDRLNDFRSKSVIVQFLEKAFLKKNFKIAPESIATRFAFETRPAQLYRSNGYKLPFGCHAWEKYDLEFWKEFIPTNTMQINTLRCQ